VPIADFERLKALAASQDQTVSVLLCVLICAFLEGGRPPGTPTMSESRASKPIRIGVSEKRVLELARETDRRLDEWCEAETA
jgi:hypothetical protein